MTDLPQVPSDRASRLYAVHLGAAVIDGLAVSTVVIHAVLTLDLSVATISVAMAAAAAIAMVLAPLTGGLLDRFGLHRAAAAGSGLTALAMIGYATAGSGPVLAIWIAAFVTAQAISGAARQGLAVAGRVRAERLPIRATMHTVLNAGIGLGTVIGAMLIFGGAAAIRTGYVLAAIASVVAAGLLLRMPAPSDTGERARGFWVAFGDRRFLAAVALAVIAQLTMPILSVLLPVWILRNTGAPEWTAAIALAVNTALVITLQRSWTRRVRTASTTVRSALLAGIGLLTAGAMLAVTAGTDGWHAVALVTAAVVALTIGEIGGGAAVWRVALDAVPPAAEGRYQAAFSMSASAARVVGPLIALPLVIAAPRAGWLILAVVMAVAMALVAVMARSENAASNSQR